jgi:hypothetical protein
LTEVVTESVKPAKTTTPQPGAGTPRRRPDRDVRGQPVAFGRIDKDLALRHKLDEEG